MDENDFHAVLERIRAYYPLMDDNGFAAEEYQCLVDRVSQEGTENQWEVLLDVLGSLEEDEDLNGSRLLDEDDDAEVV